MRIVEYRLAFYVKRCRFYQSMSCRTAIGFLKISACVFILSAEVSAFSATANWVNFNSTQSALVYSNDNLGNRLPDFSFAGYEGGGVAIPTNMAVKTNLSAIVGDNTAAIQGAINYVSALTPDANGFRGVVLLNPGTYQIAGTLTIKSN